MTTTTWANVPQGRYWFCDGCDVEWWGQSKTCWCCGRTGHLRHKPVPVPMGF